MDGRRRGQLMLGLMLATAFGLIPMSTSRAAGRGPATAPSTRPSAGPTLVERARRLVAELAANDYERRAAARIELMGFRRSDLGAIREGVRQNLPLLPSQAVVLREIVTHVY